MKKLIINTAIILFGLTLSAQTEPIKIVFDVTSKSTSVHESTIRHITFMSNNYKNAKFQVVVYSSALNMLTKEKSTVSEQIKALVKKENVSFVACELTMDRYKVKNKDLISGVGSVPNSLIEIFNKQSEGWGYIKESQ